MPRRGGAARKKGGAPQPGAGSKSKNLTGRSRKRGRSSKKMGKDDKDDEIPVEPLSADEQDYLRDTMGIDPKLIEKHGKVLYELVVQYGLRVFSVMDGFDNAEEVDEDLRKIFVEKEAMLEYFSGARRGSPIFSTSIAHTRFYEIIYPMPRYMNVIADIKEYHKEMWVERGLMNEGDTVEMTRIWATKSDEAENCDEGVEPGKCVKHSDNFDEHSLVRIPISIKNPTDNGDGKKMGFQFEDGREVLLPTPHGTVVSMTREAAGSDSEELYEHFIIGAAGTFTFVIELGIRKRDNWFESIEDKYAREQLEEAHKRDN